MKEHIASVKLELYGFAKLLVYSFGLGFTNYFLSIYYVLSTQ